MPSVVSEPGNSAKSPEITLLAPSSVHDILSFVVKDDGKILNSSTKLFLELARRSRTKANVIPPSLT